MKLSIGQIKKLRKELATELEDLDYYYLLENQVIKKLPGYHKHKWDKWIEFGIHDQWAQKLIEQANRVIKKQFIG